MPAPPPKQIPKLLLAALWATTTPLQQPASKDERKEELVVEDQQAEREEVDFEGTEEVDSNSQLNVPAEEHQQQPTTTVTWQNTGHSIYIKVEKQLTSKDEEANVNAEQLIEAISL
jgi:hypothetical protein